LLSFLRVVDHHPDRELGCLRAAVEPLRARRVGGIEDVLALSLDLPGSPVMDAGRGVQTDPGMPVLVVVPGSLFIRGG